MTTEKEAERFYEEISHWQNSSDIGAGSISHRNGKQSRRPMQKLLSVRERKTMRGFAENGMRLVFARNWNAVRQRKRPQKKGKRWRQEQLRG